jgi:hypothetical protein
MYLIFRMANKKGLILEAFFEDLAVFVQYAGYFLR